VVVDDFGVVTIRKDVEQSLLGGEVEAREDLLLLAEVLLERLLAHLDFELEILEELEAAVD